MVKLSKKNKILAGAIGALILLFFVTFGMYKWGARSQNAHITVLQDQIKGAHKVVAELAETEKNNGEKEEKLQAALKEKDAEIATKKAALEVCEKKVAQLTAPKPKVAVAVAKKKATPKKEDATTSALSRAVVVPAVATATPQLILRINIVEWSPIFSGKSLLSRDIGPVVRQGLANGTVVRTKETMGFTVNGANVSVENGSAIVNPGQVSAATAMVIRPADGAKFASPPSGLPFTTNPGELNGLVQSGVSEIWLNFILAPAAVKPPPAKKENLGGPKGPPIPSFVSIKLWR